MSSVPPPAMEQRAAFCRRGGDPGDLTFALRRAIPWLSRPPCLYRLHTLLQCFPSTGVLHKSLTASRNCPEPEKRGILGHVLHNPVSYCCELGMAKAFVYKKLHLRFFFNVFFLKVTERTARYQQKLEEKQADNLRTIKEKESQVKAKMELRAGAVTQYSKSKILEGIRLPCAFFN